MTWNYVTCPLYNHHQRGAQVEEEMFIDHRAAAVRRVADYIQVLLLLSYMKVI